MPVGVARGRSPRFPDAATRRRVLRRRRLAAAALGVAVVTVVVLAALLVANVGDAPPVATVRVTVPATETLGAGTTGVPTGTAAPGGPSATAAPAASLPWPPAGEAAVGVPAAGYAAESGPERPVPVASMTKIMTAYVVLRDHPLAPGSAGPSITVTPADAANFGTDTVTGQSNVLLQTGETLTERQMLEGLLVHSADDLAFALANWDAGSVPAFVAKMNATATRLGMSGTHFADASGFDPASVSTAADLLKVAARAMADPVFARAVRMESVTLPLAGTVRSYTPLLSTPGVIGVKSGFTTPAGGGDVLAYRALVAGRPVTALAVVTSQEGPTVLLHAGQEDLALARAAVGRLSVTEVVRRGQRVGIATVGGRSVPLVLARAVDVVAAPGEQVSLTVRVRRRPRGGDPAGTVAGELTVTAGTQRARVPVHTGGALPEPSLVSRSW